MNIRTALIEKLQKTNPTDLKNIIEEGITSKEETILPGLGVLFEMYYKDLDTNQQNTLIEQLCNLLG